MVSQSGFRCGRRVLSKDRVCPKLAQSIPAVGNRSGRPFTVSCRHGGTRLESTTAECQTIEIQHKPSHTHQSLLRTGNSSLSRHSDKRSKTTEPASPDLMTSRPNRVSVTLEVYIGVFTLSTDSNCAMQLTQSITDKTDISIRPPRFVGIPSMFFTFDIRFHFLLRYMSKPCYLYISLTLASFFNV